MASPHRPFTAFGSQLTEQLQRERSFQDRISSIVSEGRPASAPGSKVSSRSRSLSDSPKPALSPAPAIHEGRSTKDDISLTSGQMASSQAAPSTPTRASFASRGLSLQMPSTANSPSATVLKHVPLSPKLDPSNSFGSPAPVLPRRSRGLDFSRACTNLHHSTLAEDSTESSPVMSGRGMAIPQRRSNGSGSIFDSGAPWGNNGQPERSNMSGSISSVNMFDSSSDSDSENEDLLDQADEDAILTTPQVNRIGSGGAFGSRTVDSPGNDWRTGPSAAAASLMNLQRARLRQNRSRHSSSSASASTRPSPGTLSPPVMKSIENSNGQHPPREMTRKEFQSRRESLSLGTNDLMLSDMSDDDGRQLGPNANAASNGAGVAAADGPRGVVRRAVTRRSNLLPKSKNFARIHAALLEECAPIDSEAKREADVIRQVRESEPVIPSSPIHPPANFPTDLDQSPEDDRMSTDGADVQTQAPSGQPFKQQAHRNSGGLDFWNQFDERYRTPPSLRNRQSSSAMSEDANMESATISMNNTQSQQQAFADFMKYDRTSRSSTPHAGNGPTADIRTVNNKRRRDDDFDPNSFKRRAVSPGMSMQSSPVIPQSPSRESVWGQPPKTSHGHAAGERANSGGSERSIAGLPKRVGLQGMTETNDGLMNMSIE